MTSSKSPRTRVWGQRPGQPGGSIPGSWRRHARHAAATVVAALATALTLAAAGCTAGIVDQPLKPTVRPPSVIKAGELRVAMSLDYPPFGGEVDGEQAGLDIDVAAAIADKLGLKLVVVDATPVDAARMLSEGKVDAVMGGLTLDDAVSGGQAFAGAYAYTAPELLTSRPGSVTLEDLGGRPVAVQRGSTAYWALEEQYGEELLKIMPTLREALQATTNGQTEFAAGDALVAGYMLRDFPSLHFAGQLAPTTPLGIGVSKDAPKLETAVRGALDRLSASGALQTLVRKWSGDMPALESSSATTSTP